MRVRFFAPLLLAAAFAAAAPNAFAQADLPDSPGANIAPVPVPTGPTAVLDTTMGRMACKLFSQQAPNAVENFIGLAEGTKDWTDPRTHAVVKDKSLYNGTTFHRVVPGFMIQGGDPTATGTGDPGYFFADEFAPGLNFDRAGMLAMANAGPNTNGSQFFITTEPAPFLTHVHTAFGVCDDASLAIARSIAAVPTGARNKPDTDIVLLKVTIVPPGKPLPPYLKGEPMPVTSMPTAIAPQAATPAMPAATK